MAGPIDPFLPARLRRLAYVVRNERLTAGAWFRSAQRLTDSIRATILAPFRDSRETVLPNPDPAFGPATQSLWDDQIEQNVMPVIRNTMQEPWNAMMSAAPPNVRRSFDQDPYVTQYLGEAQNRLRNFPNELYAILKRIISRGIDLGTPIPDIAREVQVLLTVSGNDTYRNRATVVARTETIGATNAGAFTGARDMAAVIGDTSPEKVWLATDDSRTRHTHQEADGQRVPLESPFNVGGFQLQFPGDPSGPPQEVIQCRCTILSVSQGEELDWTDRQFRQDAEDVWADYDEQNGI